MPPIAYFLILSSFLFAVGIMGMMINRKNFIQALMALELILLAVNVNLVGFSVHLSDILGQVFSLIVLAIAAAEVSIGLAILIVYFRSLGTVSIMEASSLKG